MNQMHFKWVVSAVLLLCCVAASAFDYEYKGVVFKCRPVGTIAVIVGFDREATDVVIPAIVEDNGTKYVVTEVNTFINGFVYNTRTVKIEEGIQRIAKHAFIEFHQLNKVTIPSTIQQIGRNAFRNDKQLMFDLPSNIDGTELRKGRELRVGVDNLLVKTSDPQPPVREQPEAPEESTKQLPGSPDLDQAQANPAQAGEETPAAHEAVIGEEVAVKMAVPKEQEVAVKIANPKKQKHSKSKHPYVIVQSPEEIAAANAANAANAYPGGGVALPAPAPPAFVSDIDIDIPARKEENRNTYCVIIANEQYTDAPAVDYAIRDGELFKEYAEKTLGLPSSNVKFFKNATGGVIRRALGWMESIPKFDSSARLILYYAGHGMPEEKEQTAYIIPTDGWAKDLTHTCISLKDIYQQLSNMQAECVLVLLDACFSGMQRGKDVAVVAARGMAMKAKNETLSGKVVVLSAASGDETAMSYQEKQHGLFTYYLLNKLKMTKGKVSLGELYDYVSAEVKRMSHLTNDKMQTPSCSTSPSMTDTWKNICF